MGFYHICVSVANNHLSLTNKLLPRLERLQCSDSSCHSCFSTFKTCWLRHMGFKSHIFLQHLSLLWMRKARWFQRSRLQRCVFRRCSRTMKLCKMVHNFSDVTVVTLTVISRSQACLLRSRCGGQESSSVWWWARHEILS